MIVGPHALAVLISSLKVLSDDREIKRACKQIEDLMVIIDKSKGGYASCYYTIKRMAENDENPNNAIDWKYVYSILSDN